MGTDKRFIFNGSLFTQYEAIALWIKIVNLLFGKELFQRRRTVLHAVIPFKCGDGYKPVAVDNVSVKIEKLHFFSINMRPRYQAMIAGRVVQPGLTDADGMICFYSQPVAMVSGAPGH